MKVDVEVISNEIIKPSSPTPDHLRHYQLSFLDQLSPKTYNPLVFFYKFNGDEHKITEISKKIKKSLSEVITLFYPLAGRLKNDLIVDCNDEGVSYSVARVNSPCHLSDAINNPLPSELCKYLPFELHQLTEFALGVQLNIFEGGGIAVGLCVSHKIADALSCVVFVKSWVAIARGEADQVAQPEFVSGTLFPFTEKPVFDPTEMVTKKIVTKRFVFESSTLEAMKLRYKHKEITTGGLEVDQAKQRLPSRFEALSAFIFNRFAAATSDESSESEKGYSMILPVNLRPKYDPPLPEHSFGNLIRNGVTYLSAAGREEYGPEVVREIRQGVRKVDLEYLRKVQQGEDPHLEHLKEYAQKVMMKGGQHVSLCFTSLCRFPLYDADFGWGQPAWVSSASLCFANLIAFLDAKTGNGIEVYIGLKEEDMAKLEADEEFLKAISPVGS